MQKKQCLFPECPDEAKVRGLCPVHYRAAHYHVKVGNVTWEKLEKSGKCTHASRQVSKSWFLEGMV